MPQTFKKIHIKSVLTGFLICLLFTVDSSGSILSENQYKFMHINVNDGLSNNEVHTILKDANGFMWFGTSRGLNRFDGTKFKIFKYKMDDSTSIPFNNVDYLFEDAEQNLWIGSSYQFTIFNAEMESFSSLPDYYKNTRIPLTGLRALYTDKNENLWFLNQNFNIYKYSPTDLSVDSIRFNPTVQGIWSNFLNDLKEDSNHNLWAVSNGGEVVNINPQTFDIVNHFQLDLDLENETADFKLFIDKDDDLWIYSPGRPFGVFYLKSGSNTIHNFTDSSPVYKLNNVFVSAVEQDNDGNIWIATDHGGITILDKQTGSTTYLLSNAENNYSVAQNSVTCLYNDREGIIWAGTYKNGISYYHKNLIRFDHYKHIPSVANSLPFSDVNCFAEDDKGNLWIGTNGGGLIYFDRIKNTWKRFTHDPNRAESLASNIIVSLYIDSYKELWIGTYFGGLDRFDGSSFTHYQHNPDDPTSISDDRVWEIKEDSKRNFWVGTLNGGLNLFDREKKEFYHYRPDDMNSVGSNFIISIIEDSENNLWIGTSDGLDFLNLSTKQFKHYPPEPGVEGKLSNKNVIDLHEDSHGLIWIATSEGLNIFSKSENRFRLLSERDGLPDSNIKTILEDQKGKLWISSTNGISGIKIINYSEGKLLSDLQFDIENYNKMDGLQGKEFNEKAAYRMRSGEILFGGANGFNIFNPETLDENRPENRIVLTNFLVFNQDVKAGEPFRNRVILDKSIISQNEISLRHKENVFSVEFAALNFFHPEKNSFEYRLDGFNTEWLKVDADKDITFTNLDAGNYLLRIRVSDDGKHWKEMQQPLAIEILPPFWKSTPALLLYILLIVVVLYVARRMMLERQRLKLEAKHEHLEAERIQQIDALKTKFFTNISHEFRTPLTLILTPLEKLLSGNMDDEHKTHLVLIQRNARRLLSMVNQLLDFRKLEVQKISAKPAWGDVYTFVKEICESFQDLSENKQISLQFNAKEKHFYTYFDHDKLEKIISNLVTNAFKFTPEKGKISLTIETEKSNPESENTVNLVFRIADTGIGIPKEKQQKIFDRFYQDELPGDFVSQGSGIGLSMVNEYVGILGGTIEVESEIQQGSTFIVRIPAQIYSETEIAEINAITPTEQKPVRIKLNTSTENTVYDSEKKTVLLVEDNPDFRFYLKDNLKGRYNIIEAPDGQEGWQQVLKHVPDLVVSDVMMPKMNGVELCGKIKNDGRTSHIPVILLTAKVETEATLEGYSSGADDYISKPFDFRILESRIQNIISGREKLQQTYQAMLGLNPEKIQVTSLDEKFMKKALEIVEQNMENASFSVEDMAAELAMSRVSLYKKLLSLTQKTPIEFIRIIRLKRAADLLENSQDSVSEIAYKVGFNSPRYFSNYFKEMYNELPSEYIKKHRRNTGGFKI